MPNIDVACSSCGVVSEVYRSLADWPQTPPCPACDAPTEQVFLPAGQHSHVPAVVIFEAPDGSFRFPGSPDGLSAKAYRDQGLREIHAHGWAEVRQLERRVNQHEDSVAAMQHERRRAAHESSLAARHREVRRGIEQGVDLPELDPEGRRTGRIRHVHLGPRGRDLLRAAMFDTNRRPGPVRQTPGFFVEVYSQDRSNRDEARGADGRRQRD